MGPRSPEFEETRCSLACSSAFSCATSCLAAELAGKTAARIDNLSGAHRQDALANAIATVEAHFHTRDARSADALAFPAYTTLHARYRSAHAAAANAIEELTFLCTQHATPAWVPVKPIGLAIGAVLGVAAGMAMFFTTIIELLPDRPLVGLVGAIIVPPLAALLMTVAGGALRRTLRPGFTHAAMLKPALLALLPTLTLILVRILRARSAIHPSLVTTAASVALGLVPLALAFALGWLSYNPQPGIHKVAEVHRWAARRCEELKARIESRDTTLQCTRLQLEMLCAECIAITTDAYHHARVLSATTQHTRQSGDRTAHPIFLAL